MKQPKRLFIRIRMRMSLRTISSTVLRTPPRVTYLWGLALGCYWPLSMRPAESPAWCLAFYGDWPDFATFYSGPALVVPPSIPALELAPLSLREAAWLIAAFCTGLGLAIFAFGPKAAKVGGLLLLFLPSVLFRLLFSVSGSDIRPPVFIGLSTFS